MKEYSISPSDRAVGVRLTQKGWEPLLKAPPNNGATSKEPLSHIRNLFLFFFWSSKCPSVLSNTSEEPLKFSLALS